MLNSFGRRLLHHLIVLVVCLAFTIVGIVTNSLYNSATHNLTYTSTELNDGKNSSVKMSFSASSEGWERGVDGVTYIGKSYNLNIENNENNSIGSYKIVIRPDDTVYLASTWNGAVDIYQGSYHEYISNLRVYDFANTKFQTMGTGSDRVIKLTRDDYIIYYPSSDTLEVPVSVHQDIAIGFIFYQVKDSSVKLSMEIEYTLNQFILKNVFFDIGIISLFILLLGTGFSIFFNIRLSKLIVQKERDERMIYESIETFTSFIDAKDPYTNGHSQRVALYTKMLAEELGYSKEEVKRLYYIALLHDCGKIGIPDSILCKPARLTDEEFAIIKKHPELGSDMLKNFKSIEGIQEGVLYHHERYDGKGYPKGLVGEAIPFDARIICVADSVDAMNSNRCYRNKLSKDNIISELIKNRGTQFDPKVCDVMVELINSDKIHIQE